MVGANWGKWREPDTGTYLRRAEEGFEVKIAFIVARKETM